MNIKDLRIYLDKLVASGVDDTTQITDLDAGDGPGTGGELTKLTTDALRWRALLSSPAIRILGHSGCKEGDERSYAHFGMEIWTHHDPSYDNQYAQSTITAYANKMMANLEARENMKVDFKLARAELKDGGEPARMEACFRGEGLKMPVNKEEIPPILEACRVGDIPLIKSLVKSAAHARGISQDCVLEVTNWVD